MAVRPITAVAWGAGSFGTIAYLNVVTALILVYLTVHVQLEPVIAGALVAAARVVDAFLDPFMGWVTDRTRSRFGRRRPYLFIGALLCAMALPLVYSVHSLATPSTAIPLAFATLVFYSVGFTVFNVPYLAMPVEMTDERGERLSIMSYRVVFMMIGGLVGNAGGPYLIERLGGDGHAYQLTGFIIGGIVALFMLAAFAGTSSARASRPPEASTRYREHVAAMLRNQPFMTLIGFKVLQFIAIAAVSSTLAFYVTVVLKQDFRLLSLFGVVVTLTIVVAIPVWRWVGDSITKRRGVVIGVVGEMVSTLVWLVATPETATLAVVVRATLAGIFGSAILLNSQAMWLDTIDYDRKQSGINREGVYTSIYVFIERLGYSVGPLALGALLSLLHFDKTRPLDQQPASAELAVYIGIVWLPLAMYGIAVLLLSRYSLTDTPPIATPTPKGATQHES
ncbi:MAG: MFS transporter [Pseudomonadota bacterium]